MAHQNRIRWSTELPPALRNVLPPRPTYPENLAHSRAAYEYKALSLSKSGSRFQAIVLVRLMLETFTGSVVRTRDVSALIRDICSHTGEQFAKRKSEQSPLRFKNDFAFYNISHLYICTNMSCHGQIDVRYWLPASDTGIEIPMRTRSCSHCGSRGHMESTCCEAPGIYRLQIDWMHSHMNNTRTIGASSVDFVRSRVLVRDSQSDVDAALGLSPTPVSCLRAAAITSVTGAAKDAATSAVPAASYDALEFLNEELVSEDDNRTELQDVISIPIETVLPSDRSSQAYFNLVGYQCDT